MPKRKAIWCCTCQREVFARLTSGSEIYPRRNDLADIPFWKCDTCGEYVGCHYKTADKYRPLGVISTREIKNARKHIHALLDPMWRSGQVSRKNAYAYISRRVGKTYHTGEIKSVDEARAVYKMILELKKEIATGVIYY